MDFSDPITAVDLHACGQHGRVITGGVPDVPGETMFEKARYFEQHADSLRLRMLREPRGFPAACCNVILPPTRPEADAGFVIMEQTEYPPMSGTNTICVATTLIETGMVTFQEPVTKLVLEAPAGLIEVTARVEAGKCLSVTFENVPAFAVHLGESVEVPHLGRVTVDVAYGGMFYVIADAGELDLELVPDNGAEIARVGEMIRAAAREQLPVEHPENSRIQGPTISMIAGGALSSENHARNAAIMPSGAFDWERPATWTGALDRSPCGTGTCARMATLHARGELALEEDFRHEGILGTVFTGRLLSEAQVGPYRAVVPTITGSAWIISRGEYLLDRNDPLPDGFTVGDIWGG